MEENVTNVLLLSDFSEVAINASHFAIDLLQDQQVNFHLLNIFDPDLQTMNGSAEERRAATMAVLEKRVQKLRSRSQNQVHSITSHYTEDNLVNAARDFVLEYNIDLIVMGAVGKEQRLSTILGKHTFEIISKIKCNILAVAENTKFRKPQKLLMPLDYTASFGSKNIRFLNDPGLFKKASLNIWGIAGSGRKEERKWDPFKKEIFSGLRHIKVNFSSFDITKIYEKAVWADVQNEYDLIVLLGKNIRICDHLLHSREGLFASVPNNLPILVLHD